MGGTKKKTLASMDRSQDDDSAAGGDAKKKSDKAKILGDRKRADVLAPRGSDQDVLKTLASLRAITVYGAAKSLMVNGAVARAVIASLESKGMLTRAGGYSGHYVWTPAS